MSIKFDYKTTKRIADSGINYQKSENIQSECTNDYCVMRKKSIFAGSVIRLIKRYELTKKRIAFTCRRKRRKFSKDARKQAVLTS